MVLPLTGGYDTKLQLEFLRKVRHSLSLELLHSNNESARSHLLALNHVKQTLKLDFSSALHSH